MKEILKQITAMLSELAIQSNVYKGSLIEEHHRLKDLVNKLPDFTTFEENEYISKNDIREKLEKEKERLYSVKIRDYSYYQIEGGINTLEKLLKEN